MSGRELFWRYAGASTVAILLGSFTRSLFGDFWRDVLMIAVWCWIGFWIRPAFDLAMRTREERDQRL